ncbi:hypothetical protein emb_1d0384 [Coriobacteriaceae bacterium EMTCatB1]|nr:hypothetical protein emb_1d0384 [Coriobacteriaceae bacterium EMTCatB1]
MARTTRLYQRARSPLIQGRSRRERPWRVDFAVAVSWGCALLIALMVGGHVAETGTLVPAAGGSTAWWSAFGAGVVVAVVCGAAGVSLARGWGAVRPGRTGAIVACAAVVAYWLVFGGVAAARR